MFIAGITEILSTAGYILIALSALLIMVTVHETGHYLAGKALGFKINEFAIGFGHPLFKKKMKSGEFFSIRILPLGGYCAFEGEDEENPDARAFNNQKPWKRIIVLLAGVAFNVLTGIIVFTLFFMIYGYTTPTVDKIYQFNDSSINSLQEGDVILKVNGSTIYTLYETNLTKLLQVEEGEPITITVVRNGERMDVVTYRKAYSYVNDEEETVNNTGIGIQIRYGSYRYNFFGCLWRGIVASYQVVVLIISTIGKLLSGIIGIQGSMGGPITTIKAISTTTASYGISGYLSVLAVISVSIAFTNILPLPALDGSRIVFTIVEWIRKKPINRKVEGMIHAVGLLVLLSLSLLLDILNWV